MRYLDHADSRFAKTLGAGSLLVEDQYVYSDAVARDRGRQHLARWSVSDASAGRFDLPEWGCRESSGWLAEADFDGPPEVTAPEPQVEFTGHLADVSSKLIWLQTLRITKADIGMRTADRIEGPWSEFTPIYHPPVGDAEGGMSTAPRPIPSSATLATSWFSPATTTHFALTLSWNCRAVLPVVRARAPRPIVSGLTARS